MDGYFRFFYIFFSPQVSALVTMYSHEEDIDSAIDVFKQAIGHYQSEQVGVVEVDKTA